MNLPLQKCRRHRRAPRPLTLTRSSQLVLQSRAVVLVTNEVVRLPVEVQALRDLVAGHSSGPGDQIRLQEQRLFALGSRTSENHDPGDVARNAMQSWAR